MTILVLEVSTADRLAHGFDTVPIGGIRIHIGDTRTRIGFAEQDPLPGIPERKHPQHGSNAIHTGILGPYRAVLLPFVRSQFGEQTIGSVDARKEGTRADLG